MTSSAVLLFCLGAILVCASLIFLIETVVAFFVRDHEPGALPLELAGQVQRQNALARQTQPDFELKPDLDRAA